MFEDMGFINAYKIDLHTLARYLSLSLFLSSPLTVCVSEEVAMVIDCVVVMVSGSV